MTFTLIVLGWVNLFMYMLKNMGYNVLPKDPSLKVIVYILFPMLFITDKAMPYAIKKTDKAIDVGAIYLINLIDFLRGDFKKEI